MIRLPTPLDFTNFCRPPSALRGQGRCFLTVVSLESGIGPGHGGCSVPVGKGGVDVLFEGKWLQTVSLPYIRLSLAEDLLLPEYCEEPGGGA